MRLCSRRGSCSASSSDDGASGCWRHRFPRTGWRSSSGTSASTRACPTADRRELQGLVQIFLAEKTFEGCGGLELTDEIKVTIAAQACLLLLHRQTDVYPRLVTILVYPSAYLARAIKPIGGPHGARGRIRPARRVVDQRGRRSLVG